MLSLLQLFYNNGDGASHSENDRNIKKVRFKDNIVEEDTTMGGEPDPIPTLSWKDKLLGGSIGKFDPNHIVLLEDRDNDFELLEGDVNMTIVEGVPVITFSDRLKNILFKEMELTVIVKLLGRNIGYNTLHNRILSLWKPGPWIVYGQYLTVQSWVKHFSPFQPYPSVVLAWIRLANLPGYLYKRKIIKAIRSLIRKVVKLDIQTDNQARGRFACLAVYINLEMHLISHVLVDGVVQCVEYEGRPTVCFTCGFIVPISDNTLDSGKHSVIFKKNNNIPSNQQVKSDSRSMESTVLALGLFINGSNDRKSGGNQSSHKASFALHGRGSRFKNSGNT
ncbi:hypothetical protein J1N35_045113 [Gossypium stocksii]|uniref:DUF4283 domain-containing protein n=1 Tax=Gossypium stocksii TaxID=47602 RepID=A0A9D3UAP2_9ROSI|nr:hypothetical protein J1N35_045113 [Gossypium stocksii]